MLFQTKMTTQLAGIQVVIICPDCIPRPYQPGDSKWPFYPLVGGGHLTIYKGHLTIPKRSPAELSGEEFFLNSSFQRPVNPSCHSIFTTVTVELWSEERRSSSTTCEDALMAAP